MDDIMAGIENEDESELNIARRTRSHLRIDNFVPNDNLDFPDVDMSLYQNPNSGGDLEYKKFLNQCYSEEIGTETNNTDDNDQDYVYNDDIFSHGWKFDLNEVTELHQDNAEFPDKLDSAKISLQDPDNQSCLLNVQDLKSPSKLSKRKIDMFDDPEFARILNQQLRQHIQLLAQTYVLAMNMTNMRNVVDEALSHLNSYMKIFRNKTKPSNLLPAMELINNLGEPRELYSSIRSGKRPLRIPDPLKTIINDNPTIFIYPSLLPQKAYSRFIPKNNSPSKNNTSKDQFTENESKLLAYALNEFKGESAPYAFIASLLMTAKTKQQLIDHIKNMKRNPDENHPIRLYSRGQLPVIDLDSDASLIELVQDEETEKICAPNQGDEGQAKKEETRGEVIEQTKMERDEFFQDHDDLMNMDLDDLMAASTTISKSTILNVSNNENNKNLKNLKLKKSMLNLMSHNFLLSKDMGDLIIYEFLKAAQEKLSERNNLHLLQLLTDLMRREAKKEDVQTVVTIYQEISKFLERIDAPAELHERVVLFLDLDQATECGCAFSYLHWMRFFEFMQHVELYHDGVEAFEKKLARLIDALQKDDPHKIKLAIGNLVNKQPFLKREFESLYLNEKPHPSLFICEEDFDDITDPMIMYNLNDDKQSIYKYEHFSSKLSKEELGYASQSCSCKCHIQTTTDGQSSQHCGKCNLKFMKGRMYLVNKIKPILAEWSYTDRVESSPAKNTSASLIGWTFEEDRAILEFCRLKAEQNEETVSFDTSTFEELVNSRQTAAAVMEKGGSVGGSSCKKTAREIAERFNHLMEMYKDENHSNGAQ